jgi:hypothetical protein
MLTSTPGLDRQGVGSAVEVVAALTNWAAVHVTANTAAAAPSPGSG